MSIHEKLLKIQEGIDGLTKDKRNDTQKFDYISSEQVVDKIRPMLIENRLLLTPKIKDARITTDETRSKTTRYMTELFLDMEWFDCESGETYIVPFYAQGTDLAGEKGVGKALTYGEKYYLLKQFHIGTNKDDPDGDKTTRTGAKSGSEERKRRKKRG